MSFLFTHVSFKEKLRATGWRLKLSWLLPTRCAGGVKVRKVTNYEFSACPVFVLCRLQSRLLKLILICRF